MTRPARALAAALTAAAVVAGSLAASTAEAGIVVYEDGRTVVGRIDPVRDVTPATIVVHDPEGAAGTLEVERHRVRWFDAAADAPTAEYWTRFHDDPIEPRWHAARARHDARGAPGPEPLEPIGLPRDPLGGRVRAPQFELQAPLGWFVSTTDGVTTIVGPRGATGYAPRLHVVASPTPAAGAADEPVAWIRAELEHLAAEARLTVEELARPRAVAGGADHELVTRTDVAAGPGREARAVRALRRVAVRPGHTVVATAYADARDWPAAEPLLRRSLATLRLTEDRAGAGQGR